MPNDCKTSRSVICFATFIHPHPHYPRNHVCPKGCRLVSTADVLRRADAAVTSAPFVDQRGDGCSVGGGGWMVRVFKVG